MFIHLDDIFRDIVHYCLVFINRIGNTECEAMKAIVCCICKWPLDGADVSCLLWCVFVQMMERTEEQKKMTHLHRSSRWGAPTSSWSLILLLDCEKPNRHACDSVHNWVPQKSPTSVKSQSESEWALLPGMFTNTRNQFLWQKLHSAIEWQWQNKKIQVNNYIQIVYWQLYDSYLWQLYVQVYYVQIRSVNEVCVLDK